MSNQTMPAFADLPDAVQWSEGMLLSPQHLQQSDNYWHAQARGRLAALNPDYWGLLSLALDAKAWSDGVLRLSQVSAVLPDGAPVEFPLDDEVRQISLDLNEEKRLQQADGKPIRIWLGTPHRTGDAARQDGFLQRYESRAGDLAVDENTGSDPVPVPRLRTNLVLIADESVLSRYSAFPLLEVARNADGHLELGEYHPPMLRLGASAFLRELSIGQRLAKLSKQVWQKIRELADQVDEDDGDPASGSAQHLAQARILALALAHFDVVATGPDSHPKQAYQALALLVGQAATLGGSPIPPPLTPYRHEECAPQFEIALSYVTRRVHAITTDLERLPFSPGGENGFVRRLAADMHCDRLLIELKPRSGQDLKDIHHWLENARIASDDVMNVLRHRRLPGALARPLNRQERLALGLPDKALLFLVVNQTIDLGGKPTPVFRTTRPLQVVGMNDAGMPSGILLYRWKGEQPPLLAPGPVNATATVQAEPVHA